MSSKAFCALRPGDLTGRYILPIRRLCRSTGLYVQPPVNLSIEGPPIVQLSGLTKRFGERVLLDNVTWQVTDGDRVGLAGPNGAGKTTLLRMLAGLDETDSGSIIRPSGLTVGYLPQDGLEHTGRTLVEEA